MTYYDPRERDPSISRRPHLRQNEEWIQDLLRRGHVGRVATIWQAEDGSAFPFITPLNYVYRPEQHDIVYHGNIAGRLRANTEQGHSASGVRATFEVSELGCLLPTNVAFDLSMQYRSVIVFGTARLITDRQEMRVALTALCEGAFPDLRVGAELRPISDEELARTSVYSLKIERWSGKENWKPCAPQAEDWPPLTPEQARLRPV